MATEQITPNKKAAAKAAAKPAAKTTVKTAVKKAAHAAKAQAKEAVAKPAKVSKTPIATASKTNMSPQERQRMIEMAAYLRAESNGFCGCDLDHWLQAEAEIDSLLGRANLSIQ